MRVENIHSFFQQIFTEHLLCTMLVTWDYNDEDGPGPHFHGVYSPTGRLETTATGRGDGDEHNGTTLARVVRGGLLEEVSFRQSHRYELLLGVKMRGKNANQREHKGRLVGRVWYCGTVDTQRGRKAVSKSKGRGRCSGRGEWGQGKGKWQSPSLQPNSSQGPLSPLLD